MLLGSTLCSRGAEHRCAYLCAQAVDKPMERVKEEFKRDYYFSPKEVRIITQCFNNLMACVIAEV